MNHCFRRSAHLLLLAFVCSLAACADESVVAPVEAAAPAAETVAAEPSAGPALWQVSDDDTTVYLFGTFHALKPGITWFDGAIQDAYDASDEVALEATDTQDVAMMQALVMKYAIDPDGRTLTQVIGKETADQLEATLAKVGLSMQMIDPMEPWMAVTTMASMQMISLGFDPTLGVDLKLQNEASTANKTLVSIEGAEAQLKLLDGLPEETQVQWLELAIRDWDEGAELLNTMLEQWSDGDVAKFADEMAESMDEVPELFDALLRDRNEDFATWIVQRMDEPGTVFFAVGAGHLAGPDSVQDFLRKEGLTVTRQ
ncbi:MAG: TraB/GumN family protein [Gammaproteobacteria bacterium]